jgi:hypothetical protein
MSVNYDKTPRKKGQSLKKDKVNLLPSDKVNLGNAGTGEGTEQTQTNSNVFTIDHGVWADKTEYINKIRLDLKSTEIEEGLATQSELNGYRGTLNTKVALEVVNSIVTKNPYGMAAILGARTILGSVDAKNTYGYSGGAAFGYGLATNFFKPTIFTYKAPGIKQLTEKLKSTNSGKWFYDNVSDRVHHMADHYNPLTKTILNGTANQITVNVWTTNVIGRLEKQATAKAYKGGKAFLYGDSNKTPLGQANAGVPIKEGDVATVGANITDTYGQKRFTILTATYDSKGNIVVDTKNLKPGESVQLIGDPVLLKAIAPSPDNYWQDKLVAAATGEKFIPKNYGTKHVDRDPAGTAFANAVVGAGDFLFGNIANIFSDYSAVSNAENNLAAGRDENYFKNARMADVLQDIKSRGGDFKIDNNTGNVTITAPPKAPKKASLEENLLAQNKSGKLSTDNARAVAPQQSLNIRQNQARLQEKAQIQQQLKVASNQATLNKAIQMGNQQRASEAMINQQKAAEFAQYGGKGQEGLGVGIRKTQFGQVNIYVQQLQQLRGTPTLGTPTIGPARTR